MSSARARLADPAKILMWSVGTIDMSALVIRPGWGARTRTWECRDQNPMPYQLGDAPPGLPRRARAITSVIRTVNRTFLKRKRRRPPSWGDRRLFAIQTLGA